MEVIGTLWWCAAPTACQLSPDAISSTKSMVLIPANDKNTYKPREKTLLSSESRLNYIRLLRFQPTIPYKVKNN